MNKYILILLVGVLFISCGPTAKELHKSNIRFLGESFNENNELVTYTQYNIPVGTFLCLIKNDRQLFLIYDIDSIYYKMYKYNDHNIIIDIKKENILKLFNSGYFLNSDNTTYSLINLK